MMTRDCRQVIKTMHLGGGWYAYIFQDGTFALDNAAKDVKCDLSAFETDTLCEFLTGDNE